MALVIGDFDLIEATSVDGVQCRVYTPPGKTEQGRFALDVVARVLPYYKEYFGIAYPLPKIDLVAIADFSAGAMGMLICPTSVSDIYMTCPSAVY